MDSKSFFKIFVTFFFLFLVFSCSENKPQIFNVFPRVVFDSFAQDEELKLSVFAQITSEPKRIKKITIVHQETGLIWETDQVTTLYSPDKAQQLIGYSAFMPSYIHGFPKGRYSFQVEDMTQNIVSSNFELKNATDYSFALQSVEDTQKQYIAIYDENDIILYAGNIRDSVGTDSEIKKTYQNAKYYRNIQLKDELLILNEKQYL